jgi:archaellum component FlaF (FlaF/FlaG flagellin family)
VPNYGLDTITILTQDNGTVMSFSPDKLGFPLQPINSVSPPKIITVTNNGSSAVIFSSITTAVNFSELSTCKTVQPGQSCKVAVYFTPTVSGDIHGYLALADNGGGSPQLVELSGVATEVQLEPTSLNFGSQTVDSVSKAQNVILTNNGKGQLQIKEIAIGGTDKRDFYEVNACPATLTTGKSCTISVIFRPTATGVRSAILGVADNGGGSPQTVALSGTGT